MQVSSWNAIPASSSLAFHVQADSFMQADNTSVGNWTDNSGNGYNATQYNDPVFRTGANGINEKPAIQFNGTNQYFDAGDTSINFNGFTLFSVAKSTNNADISFRPIVSKDSSGCVSNRFNLHRAASSNNFYFETNNSTTVTANVNENVLLTAINTDVSFSKNGGAPTNNTATKVTGTTACPLQIGARTDDSTYFQGLIGEVILFKQAIPPSDKDIVECYLSSKYGIPIGHGCP